ncbi:MAG: radical SAM protein [Gemmatimonadaceae bacterium]|nr:radical SAM protein [Gemmatimonadaceae bacterium]MCW5826382.1 radical SAM protein [Gemmatimonadaceae bacterium]
MTALPVLAWRYWRANQRLGHPLQVGFAVNNTCNTFCEMCNVWQMKPKSQLGLEEIRRIFSSGLFKHCATISMTGGEPSMRRDFRELPELFADVMPALRQVNLTSNGFATEAIVDGVEHFVPRLRARGIAFGVNLSIDGIGKTHDKVRNNPKAWANLDASVQALVALRRRIPFNLVLACTFTHSNVDDAEAVLEYAKAHDVYVVFRRAAQINRIENQDLYAEVQPTAAQDTALKAFFEHVRTNYDRSHARRIYYGMLLEMLNGAERSVPCLYRKAGLFVDHHGDLYVCTVASKNLGSALERDAEELYFGSLAYRDEMACGPCRGCSHDVTLYTPLLDQVADRLRAAVTKVKR